MNNAHKTWGQVCHQASDCLFSEVTNQMHDHVEALVWFQSKTQLSDTVWNQVGDQVRILIMHEQWAFHDKYFRHWVFH